MKQMYLNSPVERIKQFTVMKHVWALGLLLPDYY